MKARRSARGPHRRQVLGRLAAWAMGPVAWGGLFRTEEAWAEPGLATSVAMPPEVGAAGGLRALGSLRFRYWGFHVYDARLYVPPGFDAARTLTQRLALSLTYARALRASDIVERSLQEIVRQAPLGDEQARRWGALLKQVLVDVQPGDRLTGLHEPALKARAGFFHNGRFTGELNDAVLAERFFGIWLSPQTSQPAMRRALLGLDQDTADHDAKLAR